MEYMPGREWDARIARAHQLVSQYPAAAELGPSARGWWPQRTLSLGFCLTLPLPTCEFGNQAFGATEAC